MATITLTAPTTVFTRITNAITTRYGYQATLPDGSANPQTKAEFARQWIIQRLIDEVKQQEIAVLAATDASTVTADINTNVVIT